MSKFSFAIEEKQPRLTKLMQNVLSSHKLGHAYLFEGPSGAGQLDMAVYLAAGIFCESDQARPCGSCRTCQRVVHGDYSDLVLVEPENNSLKIDQMREVKRDLSLTAIEGANKVFIIDQAEKMTLSAANSLLKFLEEPNPGIYLFLLTTHRENILTTIQSRCQVVHFPPLPRDQVQQALQKAGIGQQMAHLLSFMTGDVAQAQELAEEEIFKTQVQQVWPWLKLVLDQDTRAFTMVGSKWMKLTKERDLAEKREDYGRLLDLVTLQLHDCLYLSRTDQVDAEKLARPQLAEEAKKYGKKLTPDIFLAGIEEAARTQEMIVHNVGVQAALEHFILTLWQDMVKHRVG